MTKQGLFVLVKGFRKGMLDGCKPNGKCFMVCAALQGYLLSMGIETELKECDIMQGNYTHSHYYLLMEDGNIIDPTASQFTDPAGFAMPDIYIGALPEWYHANEPIRA